MSKQLTVFLHILPWLILIVVVVCVVWICCGGSKEFTVYPVGEASNFKVYVEKTTGDTWIFNLNEFRYIGRPRYDTSWHSEKSGE